ncbi:hemicentin-1-like isoform X3 [Varroa destructor]|uniref:Ig-like domain-containing protein n=1 Tax=Varroa destructor TaxID=109461 RepID=A0A7M7K680_VARDE|nr:hemicentin-1-like isoform X3 [Varroa destructor]
MRTQSCSSALLLLIPLLLINGMTVSGDDEEQIIGLDGDSTRLPCLVDTAHCGDVYLITWSKFVNDMWKRVFIYRATRQTALLDLADGATTRADFYIKNTTAILQIAPLRLTDEARYKCDVTYTKGGCPSLSYAQLIVRAKPKDPILELSGVEYTDGSPVGPLLEEEQFNVTCTTRGAKPAPEVILYQNDEVLRTALETSTEDGYITSVVTYSNIFNRNDIRSRFRCEVRHVTFPEPKRIEVNITLHLKPRDISLKPPLMNIPEGGRMISTCVVQGANPPANAIWYRQGIELGSQPPSSHTRTEDDTFDTTSVLDISVNRYDHDVVFACHGTNEVMKQKGAIPLMDNYTMSVLFTPFVWIERANSEPVKQGTAVDIICNYTANPTNIFDYTFAKDNVTIHAADDKLYELIQDHSNSSASNSPILRILNVSKDDHGNYTCSLKNEMGWGNSSNSVSLDVMYPPSAKLEMNPMTVKDIDTMPKDVEVLLRCDVEDGNPTWTHRTRWYHNGVLFNETSEYELGLPGYRDQAGNYSCSLLNDADYGNLSLPVYLDVEYPPGAARIEIAELYAVKNKSVTLLCLLDGVGHPDVHAYSWYVNDTFLDETIANNYTIDNISMDTQRQYGCEGKNTVGSGPRGYMDLMQFAPPAIVEPLPPVFGALFNDSSIELRCRIECSPECSVQWLRTHPDKGTYNLMYDPLYTINTILDPANISENYFSGVVSTLRFNLQLFPNGLLDLSKDGTQNKDFIVHYSCVSSGNFVGQSVNSTTKFQVEYAPNNVRVNPERQNVRVGDRHELVQCRGKGVPPPQYQWFFNGEVVSNSSQLPPEYDLKKDHHGNYTCIASNKHGQATKVAYINIVYKPSCQIQPESSTGDDDEPDRLVCRVDANPAKFSVKWDRNNKPLNDKNVIIEGMSAVLVRDPDTERFHLGEYRCAPNNSIGFTECAYNVEGAATLPAGLVWIVLAVIIILLLLTIIVLLICLFRRKIKQYDITMVVPKEDSVRSYSTDK